MKIIEAAKQAGAVVRWNFLGFFKNPRMIITFLFSFILCFFLSDRAIMVADYASCDQIIMSLRYRHWSHLSGLLGIRNLFCSLLCC